MTLTVEQVREQATKYLAVAELIAQMTPIPQDDIAVASVRRLLASDPALEAVVAVINFVLGKIHAGTFTPEDAVTLQAAIASLPQ